MKILLLAWVALVSILVGSPVLADELPSAGAPGKRARFVEKLAAGKKQTIVTVGTSLTEGGAWVSQLQAVLDKHFPGLATVTNLGRGASSTAVPPGRCGLDMVRSVVAARPDAVLIEFGINDCYLPYKISQEQARSNLNSIIDTINQANPETEVILQTMNCCKDYPEKGAGSNHSSNRPQLSEYYQIYREVARERHLLLIDHHPCWLAVMNESPDRFDELVPDRIHPNAKGSEVVILPTLKRSLGLKD